MIARFYEINAQLPPSDCAHDEQDALHLSRTCLPVTIFRVPVALGRLYAQTGSISVRECLNAECLLENVLDVISLVDSFSAVENLNCSF